MRQSFKSRPLRLLCLAASLGTGLGLSSVAEADTSHLPNLPIIEADTLEKRWLCDLPKLHIYLVDDHTTAGGAYYEHDGALYHIDIEDELILGFEELTDTSIYMTAPESYEVVTKVDGGSETALEFFARAGGYFGFVDDGLSTHDFSAVPPPAPDRAPSRGKIRVQSHDRCPPPENIGVEPG